MDVFVVSEDVDEDTNSGKEDEKGEIDCGQDCANVSHAFFRPFFFLALPISFIMFRILSSGRALAILDA